MTSRPKIRWNKIQTLACQQGGIRAVRFNVDGEYCLTCGGDKTLKLWNPRKPLLLKTYLGHRYDVKDACGSHDSSNIVSAGSDKCIILWDVATGQPLRNIQAHLADINCVVFNDNSSVIFSGSLDCSAKAWDGKSRSRDPIQVFCEAKDSVSSIAIASHEITIASLDGKVRRYDLRKGQMFSDDASEMVNHISLTRDSQCILVSCANGLIKLLDKSTGEVLSEYRGHKSRKYRIECGLAINDSVIISGSEDSNVYCWDLMKGDVVEKIHLPMHRVVHSLSCHPSKNELLIGAEGSVYLWELDSTGEEA